MNKHFTIALIFAVLLDIADFFGGWIPIVGDVIDIFGFILMLILVRQYAIFVLPEFIPLLDFLPFYIITIILARRQLLNRKVQK